MFTIFNAIYDLLKNRTSVKTINYYGEDFATITYQKDGCKYTVSIRKDEQTNA